MPSYATIFPRLNGQELTYLRNILYNQACRSGGIGRRKGLKIPRGQPRTGSSPVFGTNIIKLSRDTKTFIMIFSVVYC